MIDDAFRSLSNSLTGYSISPTDILSMGNSIPRTVGGIPEIGSRIPGLSSVPIPGVGMIDKVLGPMNQFRFGKSGLWESPQYAADLNPHHPKYKFLFKVMFSGFEGNDFYYYVLRADKPKVRFNHQDVNYYNFRTRVLTSVTYEPLSITFFDEIGNTLNRFFESYLRKRSGTGNGHYGIDRGFGEASSSLPYGNGYSDKYGQRIIVEQIFDSGTQSNRFTFINPRIEQFDFDELSMEESSTGSHATILFTYDAIEMMTVYGSTIHSWGNVDLLRGGGTSGPYNGGNINGIPTTGIYEGVGGALDKILRPMSPGGYGSPYGQPTFGHGNVPMNGQNRTFTDTLSQGISNTLNSIKSGANSLFGGNNGNWTY
jgi:hypothetical protein